MASTSVIATTTANFILSNLNTSRYYNIFGSIHHVLNRIMLPYMFIVAFIGLITNTSTVVLLSKSFVTKDLRHKWTLIALAFSDILYNFSLLTRAIQDVLTIKVQYICIFISCVSNLAELLSASYTVLFTVQRYIAVRYPLKVAIQKRSSPIVYLLIIFIASLIFSLALTKSNFYVNCNEEFHLSWFIADTILSCIIPFTLIAVFNILIVNFIRKHSRSPITVQSTLLRFDQRTKSGLRSNSKNNNGGENYRMTSSSGNSHTSQWTISEADIEKKIYSNYSLSKIDENSVITNNNNSKKHKLTSNISNDTDILANDTTSPMPLIEKKSSDAFSNNQSASSSQSIELQCFKKKKRRCNLSNSDESRKLSYISNDVDSISHRETPTAQSIRVTRMLIFVSTCFLLLNAPTYIFSIILKFCTTIDSEIHHQHKELEHFQNLTNLTDQQIKDFVYIPVKDKISMNSSDLLNRNYENVDDPIGIHILYILIVITQLMSHASYSINFFLYSFSGVTFRKSFKQIFYKFRLN